jgi:O-antigen/teichoic acid export membrane protein
VTAAVGSKRRAVLGRLSWGLGDQAVSSLTNFAVGVVVARSLGVTAFGVFSLAWVTYGVVLNVSRGLATDPLMVRFSGVAVDRWRDAAGRAAGTALAVGALAGAACVLVGLLAGGSVGGSFTALGVLLPALLLQDCWRFAFFAAGLGARAFANDVIWAVTLVPALAIAATHGGVGAFVLAWGGAGAVAAAVGVAQARLWPHRGVAGWLRAHRDLGPRYLVENVANSGGSQLRMYGVGAIAGLADVGTIRGAELLMGPFLAVLMGLSLVTVAEAARVLRANPARLRTFCLLLGGGQALAALCWGGLLLVLVSDGVGRSLLGDVWPHASQLIVPATLSVLGAALGTGAATGLRALGAARRSLRAQLVNSLAYVGFGLTGAAAGGALGSAWGVAAATTCGALVWWAQLRAGIRERPERTV